MTIKYRLALDLGSNSLGWAVFRLTGTTNEPSAIIKAGVRIFSSGRNPTGSSLAVSRRDARLMRRRRDRLLKRKARMMATLIKYGFFPTDETARRSLEKLNPYELRAKGLNEALSPAEFGRALFHINQRRGFKSNRKTDKQEDDSGALKAAIKNVRESLSKDSCRTVGEFLYQRMQNGQTVRARYRKERKTKADGKTALNKSYDLYIDRAMIEDEFDKLWGQQCTFNKALFNETAREELKDVLLHQRRLRPVVPGRCTLLPEKERAPLALPSAQRFRMYQEVNNLRILRDDLRDVPLSLEQRNKLIAALEKDSKCGFATIRKLLGLPGSTKFNMEDSKRESLKGNLTSAVLSKDSLFGSAWSGFNEDRQDAIVQKLLAEESEAQLVQWLTAETGISTAQAEAIANVDLPKGYGNLSIEALSRILPVLQGEIITYDKAVLKADFDHHSHMGSLATGEILDALPYYGEPETMRRHMGKSSGEQKDPPEIRFGRIANPTVHIGLNELRKVVNALINEYGAPSEIIIELARELKQNKRQRDEEQKQQTENQKRNQRIREDIGRLMAMEAENVTRADIEKMVLWEELGSDAADRRCPYSGTQLSIGMVLSSEVEVDHILPFKRTLDDSRNNKTVAIREANRIKGNRTPWEAQQDFAKRGWEYEGIIKRAAQMKKEKRYRFAEDGIEKWLRDEKDFLARALNDTRYLSRIAKEYLTLICPRTRAIPGRMTAMLRGKFGLNNVLGVKGEKNRNDHRHHAVDACVIGVTDQRMLQQFATASASAREKQLDRLVEKMPLPWPTYREHVERAVTHIWVSHRPDHDYKGQMHNDTAYGLLDNGYVRFHKVTDGKRTLIKKKLAVIPFSDAHPRHGYLPDGNPRPYKGYKGDSNYRSGLSHLNRFHGEISGRCADR